MFGEVRQENPPHPRFLASLHRCLEEAVGGSRSRSRREADDAVRAVNDWAGLAQEDGFADQAHLVRATKRITGFSPMEFTRRYEQDESFWLYRLWV